MHSGLAACPLACHPSGGSLPRSARCAAAHGPPNALPPSGHLPLLPMHVQQATGGHAQQTGIHNNNTAAPLPPTWLKSTVILPVFCASNAAKVRPAPWGSSRAGGRQLGGGWRQGAAPLGVRRPPARPHCTPASTRFQSQLLPPHLEEHGHGHELCKAQRVAAVRVERRKQRGKSRRVELVARMLYGLGCFRPVQRACTWGDGQAAGRQVRGRGRCMLRRVCCLRPVQRASETCEGVLGAWHVAPTALAPAWAHPPAAVPPLVRLRSSLLKCSEQLV